MKKRKEKSQKEVVLEGLKLLQESADTYKSVLQFIHGLTEQQVWKDVQLESSMRGHYIS